MDQTQFGFEKISVLAKKKNVSKAERWRQTLKSRTAVFLPVALLFKGISGLISKR